MLTDMLEIHFVELPKFLEEREILKAKFKTKLDRWLVFLTIQEKEVLEEIEMAEPAIKKAITVLDMLSRDPETVRLAELRMKQILDEKSMIEGAKAEGIKLGEEKGKIEGKIEVAKNAINNGLDIHVVMAITGLSEEEVIKIKSEIVSH